MSTQLAHHESGLYLTRFRRRTRRGGMMWNRTEIVEYPNQSLSVYLKKDTEGSSIIFECGDEGKDGFMRLTFSPENARGLAKTILELLGEEE